jgi:hypothetical protein
MTLSSLLVRLQQFQNPLARRLYQRRLPGQVITQLLHDPVKLVNLKQRLHILIPGRQQRGAVQRAEIAFQECDADLKPPASGPAISPVLGAGSQPAQFELAR